LICKEEDRILDAVIDEAKVVYDVPLEDQRVCQEGCVLTNDGRDILDTRNAVSPETAEAVEHLEAFINTEEDTVDGKV
jgi:hypothetical protein